MRWQKIVYIILICLLLQVYAVSAEEEAMFDAISDDSAASDVPMSNDELMQEIDYTERDEAYGPGINSIPLENSMFTGDYIPQSVEESRMFRPYSEAETITVPEELIEGEKKKVPKEKTEFEPVKAKGWNLVDYIFAKTHPYVFSDIAYDSNIWLVQTNKKDDIVNVARPGALFAIGRKKSGTAGGSDRFELEGGMKVSTYAYSGFNRQYPYASVRANTGRRHYKFNFNHFFKQDFTQGSWLTENQQGFVSYILNATSLRGKMEYNRFAIEAIYNRTAFEFPFNSNYRSSNNQKTNGMVLTGLYRPLEMKKTVLLAEFDYGRSVKPKATTNSGDYDYYFVYIGVKGRFTKKITGLLKAGFESNNYANGEVISNFPVMISLNYRFSPKTTFLLGAKESGLSSANTALGEYIGNYATLHCLHSFTPKIGADLGMNVYSQTYQNPKRVDTGYGFSAKLEYKQNKQSKFTVEYNYALKNARAGHNAGFKNTVLALRAEILF